MVMRVDTACTIINEQLVFLPDWTIKAEPFTHRFESAIRVTVEYPACATEREEAADGYPRQIKTGGGWVLYLHCDSPETLLRELLTQVILPIFEHESREALRLRPTFWAPFHPHKTEGMERWGKPHQDIQFGLA